MQKTQTLIGWFLIVVPVAYLGGQMIAVIFRIFLIPIVV